MTNETTRFTPEGYELKPEERAKLKAALAAMNRGIPTVFSSVHLYLDNAGDMIPSVFFPIALGGLKDVFPTEEDFKSFNPVFYEYMERAGPRSVNGYPSFFSMHMIRLDEWNEIVRELMAEEGIPIPEGK